MIDCLGSGDDELLCDVNVYYDPQDDFTDIQQEIITEKVKKKRNLENPSFETIQKVRDNALCTAHSGSGNSTFIHTES